jgi:PAS domain-containing protein
MTDAFTNRTPVPGGAILFASLADADSRDDYFRKILDDLPAAIYVTDAFGRITYFNDAAATLWGHRPVIGTSEWCRTGLAAFAPVQNRGPFSHRCCHAW